jgi:hypothetical protein
MYFLKPDILTLTTFVPVSTMSVKIVNSLHFLELSVVFS